MNRLDKIGQQGKLTIGLELPLDNDWSASGDHKRRQEGKPFGVPDITNHSKLAQMADELEFSALWKRDMALQLRHSDRPVEEVISEISALYIAGIWQINTGLFLHFIN
ncbi:hypothetical protein [Pedobacter sp. NJ-S-72]